MTDLDPNERLDQIRDEIGRLIGEAIRLRNPDDDPITVGWTTSYEWTSVELEQTDRFGTGTLMPREQSGALTRGLFEIGADHFGAGGDD